MSRRWALACLGLAAFLAFAIAASPARVAFDLAANPIGARAGLVQGPVWDAQLLRLSMGGPPIAEVSARLRPAGLLAGAARFDVSVRDPDIRGTGMLVLTPGGRALEEVSGVIAASRLPTPVELPPGQAVSIEIDRLALDAQGRCLQAQGRVRTAALAAAGEAFGAELPLLEGALLCAGEVLAVQLDGANETLTLSGRIRFEAAGPVWRVDARTDDRDMIAALSLLGFVQTGPGVFGLDSGALQEDA